MNHPDLFGVSHSQSTDIKLNHVCDNYKEEKL